MPEKKERAKTIEVYERILAMPDLASSDAEKLDCLSRLVAHDMPDDVFRLMALQVLHPGIMRRVTIDRLEELKMEMAA